MLINVVEKTLAGSGLLVGKAEEACLHPIGEDHLQQCHPGIEFVSTPMSSHRGRAKAQ